MAIARKPPALSLETVVARDTIDIDGVIYDLRNADEMPFLAYRGHLNTFTQAGALLAIKQRTEAQESALDAALVPLVEALVVAPKAVLAKLTNDQRFAIVTVFSALLPEKWRTADGAHAPTGAQRTSSVRRARKTGKR